MKKTKSVGWFSAHWLRWDFRVAGGGGSTAVGTTGKAQSSSFEIIIMVTTATQYSATG